MVLKKEQKLEDLITKNGVRIMRLLCLKPYAGFGLGEISSLLGISKSNILRFAAQGRRFGIVREEKEGRKKLYRVDGSNEFPRILWLLYNAERKAGIKPQTKNLIEHIFRSVEKDVEFFIVFGSVAYGLENASSDIDILVVGDRRIAGTKFEFMPHKVEFHFVGRGELERARNFVALEAVMNGIVYKGDVFPLLCGIRSFPKAYVLFRLQKAKEFLYKAAKLKGEAGAYYKEMARVSLGEIEALLLKKRILPKKLVRNNVDLEKLEEMVSGKGDEIWLT